MKIAGLHEILQYALHFNQSGIIKQQGIQSLREKTIYFTQYTYTVDPTGTLGSQVMKH